MASFNSASSAFPRQAVVASATLPPQAPVPSFFGNTGNTVPSTTTVMPPPPPSLATTPPADSFTATAPAPVDQTLPVETPPTETPKDSTALATNTPTAPEATDAQKAEDAKKENGFVKFAKSPWGIGAGVILGGVGLAIWQPWKHFNGGNSSIAKLEKVVKDLSQDGLDVNGRATLLEQYAGHLRALTYNTSSHHEATWGKLSSAIEAVHAKHGGHEDGQIALLHGLGDSTPDALLELSTSARKAIFETSTAYIEGIPHLNFTPEAANFHRPLLGKAAEWLLHPQGEGLGIQNADDLVKTSGALSSALYKLRPEGERLSDIHKAVLGFSASDGHLSQLNASLNPLKDDVGVELTDIKDIRTAGHALFNARLKGPQETKEVLDHLNTKGIQGYGDLSKPNGFEKLGENLVDTKTGETLPEVGITLEVSEAFNTAGIGKSYGEDSVDTKKGRPLWLRWDPQKSEIVNTYKRLQSSFGKSEGSKTP